MALAKGRLAQSTVELFERANLDVKCLQDDSRKLVLENEQFRFFPSSSRRTSGIRRTRRGGSGRVRQGYAARAGGRMYTRCWTWGLAHASSAWPGPGHRSAPERHACGQQVRAVCQRYFGIAAVGGDHSPVWFGGAGPHHRAFGYHFGHRGERPHAQGKTALWCWRRFATYRRGCASIASASSSRHRPSARCCSSCGMRPKKAGMA